ncbi:MAG: hypothetical protein QHH75_12750 [Bacillota bacterium]|nr:hypothetical protein [Bacillota bacterium]
MRGREKFYEAGEVAKMLGKPEPKIQAWICEHLGEKDVCVVEGKKKITESGFRKLAWLSEFTLKQPALFRSLMRDFGGVCQCRELREQVRSLTAEMERLRQDNQVLSFNWELEKQKRKLLKERLNQLALARDDALQLGQKYCDELEKTQEKLNLLTEELTRVRAKPWWKQLWFLSSKRSNRGKEEAERGEHFDDS